MGIVFFDFEENEITKMCEREKAGYVKKRMTTMD
jgi:hypothetical protein